MSWLDFYIKKGYKTRLETSDAMPLHSRDVPSANYDAFILSLIPLSDPTRPY